MMYVAHKALQNIAQNKEICKDDDGDDDDDDGKIYNFYN